MWGPQKDKKIKKKITCVRVIRRQSPLRNSSITWILLPAIPEQAQITSSHLSFAWLFMLALFHSVKPPHDIFGTENPHLPVWYKILGHILSFPDPPCQPGLKGFISEHQQQKRRKEVRGWFCSLLSVLERLLKVARSKVPVGLAINTESGEGEKKVLGRT